jgi:hypothetical protein
MAKRSTWGEESSGPIADGESRSLAASLPRGA